MFAIEGWRKNIFTHTGYCNFHHVHNKVGRNSQNYSMSVQGKLKIINQKLTIPKTIKKFRSAHCLLQKHKKYA